MTRETDEIEAELRAIAAELWPSRPTYLMSIPDPVLTLAVMLRREIRAVQSQPMKQD